MNKMSKIAVQLCVVFSLSLVQAASYQKKQATFNDCEVSWSLKQSVDSRANELANDCYKIYALSVHNESNHPIYLNPAGYFDNAFNAYISRKKLENVVALKGEYTTRQKRAFKLLWWNLGITVLVALPVLVGGTLVKLGVVDSFKKESYVYKGLFSSFIAGSVGLATSILIALPWSCRRRYRARIPQYLKPILQKAGYMDKHKPVLYKNDDKCEYQLVDGYVEIPPHCQFEDLLLIDTPKLTFNAFTNLSYAVALEPVSDNVKRIE